VDGHQIVGVLAISEETMKAEGLLNVATYLRPTTREALTDTHRSMAVVADAVRSGFGKTSPDMPRHVRNILAHPLQAAALAVRRSIGRGDEERYLQLSFQTEQSPNPASRVVLGSDRDRLGRPVARLEWRLSDLDKDSIRRSQEIVDQALRAAPIGRVVRFLGEEDPPAPVSGFWHHIGTTRMHSDPRKGVVDADCRIHSISNAYVAGSSVFPTGGFANPTLTIVALTLRLADHLKKLLAPTSIPPT
jgi:choline dehydrogenase-like flavoprotein